MVAKVRTLINLHLMTGTIGKPGCGPFSLTGQSNAHGWSGSGGALPHSARLSGGEKSSPPGGSGTGLGIAPRQHFPPGWTGCLGHDSRPGAGRGQRAVGGRHQPGGEYARPGAHEKGPGQVPLHYSAGRLLPHRNGPLCPCAAARRPVGGENRHHDQLRAHGHPVPRLPPSPWRSPSRLGNFFADIGRRLGFTAQFSFAATAEVRAEFIELTRGRLCDQTGITYASLAAEGPLQWPRSDAALIQKSQRKGDMKEILGRFLPHSGHPTPPFASPKVEEDPGKRLYTNYRFPTDDGRARFAAFHPKGLAEAPEPQFPLVLTNGRLYGHWHTLTRTGRIPKTAAMHPEPFLEVHPRDAKRRNIEEGDWVEVRSRRGTARLKARVTKAIAPGTVFMPMHWGFLWSDDAEVNALTHPELCPISLEPELKACAVEVVPVILATPEQRSRGTHTPPSPPPCWCSLRSYNSRQEQPESHL